MPASLDAEFSENAPPDPALHRLTRALLLFCDFSVGETSGKPHKNLTINVVEISKTLLEIIVQMSLRLEAAIDDRNHCGCGEVIDTQLSVDTFLMPVDRTCRTVQLLSDLGAPETVYDFGQNEAPLWREARKRLIQTTRAQLRRARILLLSMWHGYIPMFDRRFTFSHRQKQWIPKKRNFSMCLQIHHGEFVGTPRGVTSISEDMAIRSYSVVVPSNSSSSLSASAFVA